MGLLGFFLATMAVFLAAGALASLPAWLLARVARRLPVAAARRADLALVAGVLPMLVAVSVVVGVTAPSLLDAAGLHVDHCAGHDHHVHLCVVHAASIPPRIAAIGAVGAALFFTRTGAVVSRYVGAARRLTSMERLGRRDGAVIHLPGSPRLCHAVGVLRPRVLLSEALVAAVTAEVAGAALAHEHAHLRRRDPLALALLAFSAPVALPGAAREALRSFRDAAEEAADADAAREVGGLPVAEGLVTVTRILRRSPLVALGFGETGLERRVRALLAGAPAAPAVGLAASVAILLASLLLALLSSAWLHHEVETFLG